MFVTELHGYGSLTHSSRFPVRAQCADSQQNETAVQYFYGFLVVSSAFTSHDEKFIEPFNLLIIKKIIASFFMSSSLHSFRTFEL